MRILVSAGSEGASGITWPCAARPGQAQPGQAQAGQAQPGPPAAKRTRPARLRAGSRVAVVAPSGRNDPAVVADGCRLLAAWGLDVRVAPHALAGHDELGYLAGADAHRAADLQQAWLDPGIEAVLSARGGYGAQRIADRLDWAAMAAVPPKIFTGFSDITALHEAFALRLGVPTLHAPNVGSDSFTAFPEAQRSLRRALFEPDRPDARVLAWDGADRLVPGRAAGLTAGGNLSLLAAGLGTPDGRQAGPAGGGFAGCILLLEDVREECYRLDRMLTQLLRAGALDGVTGIALGSWAGCGAAGGAGGTGGAGGVRQVMQDRLGGLGVPVAWGLPFGHVAPQSTIPLGVPAELDADQGTLTLAEHAVA